MWIFLGGSQSLHILNCYRCCQIAFQKGCTKINSHHQLTSVPASYTLANNGCVSVPFEAFAHLISGRRLVCVCFPFITGEMRQLCLFAHILLHAVTHWVLIVSFIKIP